MSKEGEANPKKSDDQVQEQEDLPSADEAKPDDGKSGDAND